MTRATRVIGIDPGLQGALASWDGETLEIYDVPIVKAKSRGNEINIPALVDIVNKLTRPRIANPFRSIAYVEKNSVRPMEGIASAQKGGMTAGILTGCVAMRCNHVVRPTPNVWKKVMNLTKDKDYSRTKAIELFPNYHTYFARKKDHDRAEAALLALYGFREQQK